MSVPFVAKALFEYAAVEAAELSVEAGDFVTVEEVNESGWCLARKGDLNGWLPTDYVERVETEVGVAPAPIQVSKPANSREIQATEAHAVAPAAVAAPAADAAHDQPSAPAAQAESVPAPSTAAASSSSAERDDLREKLSDTLSSLGISSGSGSGSASGGAPPAVPSSGKSCSKCQEPIRSAFVMAKGQAFHPACFSCFSCACELGGKAYLEKDDKFYCEEDYYKQFNPTCGACKELIKGPYISALDQNWHPETCFCCTACKQPFAGNQFRKHGAQPYCESCFEAQFAPKCAKCLRAINGSVFEALEQKFHQECFTCAADERPIGEGVSFHLHEGKVYCPAHFEALFLQKCHGCAQPIKGQYIKVLEQTFHAEGCWKCNSCQTLLKADTCAVEGGKFFCKPCLTAKRAAPQQAVLQQMGSNPQAVPNMAPAAAAPAPAAAAAAPAPAPAPASSGLSAAQAADKASAALAAIQAKKEADAAAAAAAAAAPAPAASAYADPLTHKFPYALLKDKESRPKEVDPTRKEAYLSDAEFSELFKLSREDFAKLPDWKKKALKTPLMLF